MRKINVDYRMLSALRKQKFKPAIQYFDTVNALEADYLFYLFWYRKGIDFGESTNNMTEYWDNVFLAREVLLKL